MIAENKWIFLVVVLLSVFFVSIVSAAGVTNITAENNAANCLNNSRVLMNQMIAENLTVLRVNDTLLQAEVMFKAQKILSERRQKSDFTLVSSYCDSISKIYSLSLNLKDSLSTLLRYYNSTVTPEMNTSSIDVIISEAIFEMQSERYEKVQPLIDRAYEEIANVRARSTTLNLFVESTTQGLKTFFLKNWIVITVSLFVIIFLWFIFKTPVKIKLLSIKLEKLADRRESVKRLIMKSQEDYFQKGNIADSEYKIRVANYAELVRDIDRQVPLIKEVLAKLQRGKE